VGQLHGQRRPRVKGRQGDPAGAGLGHVEPVAAGHAHVWRGVESQVITGDHRGSQGITGDHRGPQGITGDHRCLRLHAITHTNKYRKLTFADMNPELSLVGRVRLHGALQIGDETLSVQLPLQGGG